MHAGSDRKCVFLRYIPTPSYTTTTEQRYTTMWRGLVFAVFCLSSVVAQDECLDVSNTCPLKQTCSDMDMVTMGDWICVCDAPTTGMSTMATQPATCTIDECTATCPTCSAGVCTAAGQLCIDPNPAADSLRDWICQCQSPALPTFSYASPAVCVLNECGTKAATCSAAGQTCVDPNIDVNSQNDWECRCNYPHNGVGLQTVATCTYDECLEHFALCVGGGQQCVDANTDAASLRDWKCVCVAPATGEQSHGLADCGMCFEEE